MELYAGMVENMDHHVGRLIDYLKKIGEYDNTIFIVFGDNGAEGADLFKMIAGTPGTRDFLFASDAVVANPSQCLGRSPFLRRLRSDVGAGFDDARSASTKATWRRAASAMR
jgi:arylsulfatase A-like enzyme